MIVGAGLAGLIAAHAFPKMQIFEAEAEPRAIHKALLRFRSDAVGDLIGIEFRPVRVHKGIWFEGREVNPSIRFSNLYARKVIGKTLSRSIESTESVTRYIAPTSLYEELTSRLESRITWNSPIDFSQTEIASPVVNTAPLTFPLADLKLTPRIEFRRSGIVVKRFKIANTDVFQTIYFPDPATPVYRASITGDLLICEFCEDPKNTSWWNEVAAAFGLFGASVDPLETSHQKYGKIAPIDEGIRRALIAKLTDDHQIYSLGRFATWRNILLDDLVHDIAVVRRLMNASTYERRLVNAR